MPRHPYITRSGASSIVIGSKGGELGIYADGSHRSMVIMRVSQRLIVQLLLLLLLVLGCFTLGLGVSFVTQQQLFLGLVGLGGC